jgi:hypothetical protein
VSTRASSGSESHRKHVVARKLESLEKVGTSKGCGGDDDDADDKGAGWAPALSEADIEEEIILHDLEVEIRSFADDEISRGLWTTCCGSATVM